MGLTEDRPLATGMRDERASQTTLGKRPLGPSCERSLAHNRSPSRACVVRAVLTKLGCDSLVVSDRGLRHGLIADRFALGPPSG